MTTAISTIHAPTLTRFGWMLHHYTPTSHYVGHPAPHDCPRGASHATWYPYGFLRHTTYAGRDWPVLHHAPRDICLHDQFKQLDLFGGAA